MTINNQKTEAERMLCDWAKCGARYTERDGPYVQLVAYANAVWDEAHPKRTLDDVEREMRQHDMSTAIGLECVCELAKERSAMMDKS